MLPPRQPGSRGPRQIVLALGSNLGDRLGNLQAGIDHLASASAALRCTAVSPVYSTAPVGGPPQPDYLNAVAARRQRPARDGQYSTCAMPRNKRSVASAKNAGDRVPLTST